ncbi:MAG: DUF302 domain-containing protein [Actinobacteria bacterium]|uniref:Unannotated protein n=1 Tax=freshwater metagenome TaxID=449393 RepID=A0A6J6SCC7_9ZZZZ|nr:DUF302 domain-containing protein [Actinomycetota bacterium]
MTGYTLGRTVATTYDATVDAVRAALDEQGFGVLTEIDLAATLHAKLGVSVGPQVILGACRPQLAHLALQADPSIATLLPCNVVVRAIDATSTRVEVFDPAAMTRLAGASTTSGSQALAVVVADARERLGAMLASLD